jgi:hypothetical protein
MCVWIIGYKAWGALMAQSLTENGFVVMIPDYRNFPQATIGDMIEDARNATCSTGKWNFPRFHFRGSHRGVQSSNKSQEPIAK